MRQVISAAVCMLWASFSLAQGKDSSIFEIPIQMDEVVVKATREGWDVGEFIKRVKTDTTFYKAFRSLHLVSYNATNDIKVFNEESHLIDSLYSLTHQMRTPPCRTMQVLQQTNTPHFFKRNGDYRYYTADLYDNLFFTHEKVCNEDDIVAGMLQKKGEGKMEKHKSQLKQLIFNPGSQVEGIPFIGNKAAIFDPEVSYMYRFRLMAVSVDGEDCYLFQALPKKEYMGKVVYNELSTWFRKSDYAILARNYSLSYHNVLFDFDVTMKVRLQNVNGKLLPSTILYNGNWHVVTKGREIVKFHTAITY